MANPKGNPQNLITQRQRSKSERSRIASMGGKASVESKRQKRNMGEVAKAFLDLDVSDAMKKELKKKYKLDDDLLSNRFPLVAQLYSIIMDKNEIAQNKISAIKMLIEIAGESPQQIAAEKAIERQSQQVDDDPFSQSIKEMFAGGEK